MVLEVIATTAEEARIAEAAGADRIELIAAIEEGGLTPSLAVVEEAAGSTTIPIRVMVRPHSRSFEMSPYDIRVMCNDIGAIRKTGAAGIVLGSLTADGIVDEDNLRRLLDVAGDLAVTFHRAFDDVRDQAEALEVLSRYPQIRTVLTSGGMYSALDAEAELGRLVRLAQNTHLTILAGSGLTIQSLESFVRNTGVREVHMGSGVRMSGFQNNALDPARIRQARELLDRLEPEEEIERGERLGDEPQAAGADCGHERAADI
ncbi:copper homeostasis protein CutC [Paenibacillus sp. R14(2021)]|uniref:copper homeostasis protein CutC n=1 Tax=Paenibacillus sp. R14(2021) TaxID=2859228 RepID=UPI001C6132F8|nr:copper homeostasis protein CutC [Paenibacillus sp. R14(2021)]